MKSPNYFLPVITIMNRYLIKNVCHLVAYFILIFMSKIKKIFHFFGETRIRTYYQRLISSSLFLYTCLPIATIFEKRLLGADLKTPESCCQWC
jgi:hypothetical protein